MKKINVFRSLLIFLMVFSSIFGTTTIKMSTISSEDPQNLKEIQENTVNKLITAGWKQPEVISDGKNGTANWNLGMSWNPDIAMDSKGNIHVVWVDSTNGIWGGGIFDREIMYANYSVTTGQWSHAIIISDGWNGTANWNLKDSLGASIAIDSYDNIHVVWKDDTDLPKSGTDYEIMYANRSANGAKWSHAVVVSDCWNGTNNWNTGSSDSPEIAVDSNDNIHVVWQDNTPINGIDKDILYANRSAGSASWSHVQVVSIDSNNRSESPDLFIDDDGYLHAVWHDQTKGPWGGSIEDREIMYANRSAGAATWSPGIVISDGWNGTADWNKDRSFHPSIVVDSQGNVHVVWEDNTDLPKSGNDYEIMYANRSAGVASWSHARVISDDSTNWNKDSSRSPDIAVDVNDNLHVVWNDRTAYLGTGSDYDIFYLMFHNNTGSWSPIAVVSDDNNNWNNDFSAVPCIFANKTDQIYIAWTDNTDLQGSGDDTEIMFFDFFKTISSVLYSSGGDDDDDNEPAIIPGYDLSILIMAIALGPVVIILKRRKIIEMFKK